jgi:TM2 domain-containing membrane protein YozV
MNCINHPETPVASFCQNCGKALCSQCTRPVGNFIYCEPCLAAKVGVPGAQPGAPFPPAPAVPSSGPNPALATILGVIPGVGAMYNGQFVKAMIHVLVFVILIALTDQHDFFGFFIAAWVLYQIFDANQTAKARRDGLPLPDPFGINELAMRMGNSAAAPGTPVGNPASYPPPPGYTPPGYTPPVYPPSGYTPSAYPPSYPPAGSFVGAVPPPPYTAPGATAYTPPPPNAPYPPPYPEVAPAQQFADAARRNEPAGAIALIVLGLLFLFGTLGIFRFDWIGRGWPLILIAIGVWLFYKRARETNPPGGGQ